MRTEYHRELVHWTRTRALRTFYQCHLRDPGFPRVFVAGIIRQQGVHVRVLKIAGDRSSGPRQGHSGFSSKVTCEIYPSVIRELNIPGNFSSLRGWSNTTSPVGFPPPPRSHPGHGHHIVSVRGNRQQNT